MEKYVKIFIAVIPHNGEDENGNNLGKIQGMLNYWSSTKALVKLSPNADGSSRPNPQITAGVDATTIVCYRLGEPKPVQSNVEQPATAGAEPMPF
jgi:hypothetical protein